MKLLLDTLVSGYAVITQLNSNFTAIATAFENTLSRDGTSPNAMGANIDMNGNDLLNVNAVYTSDLVVGGTSLATQVANAAASATAALVSETNAAASEANAATSETNAAASASIVADWDYLGAWTTATAYKVNNIVYVSSEGSSYICLVAHTSGTFSTDLGNGYWGLIALQGSAGTGTGDMLKSENLSGLADYSVARSNLGVAAATATLLKADNLSGLASAATARTNLGLGTAAVVDTGTASGNVPLNSDIHGKQTIWIPAEAMVPDAVDGASLVNLDRAGGMFFKALKFSPTVKQKAWFSVKMPKSWNVANLTGRVVFARPDAAANTTAVYGLVCAGYSNGDSLDAVSETDGTGVGANSTNTNTVYFSSESAAISMLNTAGEQDILRWKVARLVDHASDLQEVDSYLLGVELYYVVDAHNDA